MTVAYLRISTEKQHLRNQQEEILRFAARHNLTVDRWLTEVVSGRKSGRKRKLGALLRRMKRGDTLIVTELSRLSRTLTEIMSIMGHCLERGIQLYSTKDGYAFDNSINSKVLCFAFGLVAEIERNLISMRTREALAVRRADGVVLGRRKGSCVKQKMLLERRDEVVEMLREGCTLTSVCRRFGISSKTFHRVRQVDEEINALYQCRT
ncbi:invertase [Alistipes sp. An116]|uniref:recombinase family protein n=1 Tax=Alistipes sp. An116 TaxID=1965546 RepID=UPI000B37DB93|nr:recombinase family protein [Alistipes sp. An116]OUQ49619.1 invertase [Alistipes sp. An116]